MTEVHTKNLLAVSLHGFGVLQVHLQRGDVWEQLSDLHPEGKMTIKI